MDNQNQKSLLDLLGIEPSVEIDFTKLRQAAKIATDELAKKFEKKPVECSEKAKKLAEIFDKEQPYVNGLHEMFEVVIGEPIPSTDKIIRLRNYPFAVVVPIKRNGSHNYAIGKPVMLVRQGVAMRVNGTLGNNLPEFKDYVRPATEEEIEDFFDRLSLVNVKATVIASIGNILDSVPEDDDDDDSDQDEN